MPPGVRPPGQGVMTSHGSVAKMTCELVLGTRYLNQQMHQVSQMMENHFRRTSVRAGHQAGQSFGNSFAHAAKRSMASIGSSVLGVATNFGSTLLHSGVAFAGWGISVAAEMEKAEIAMQTLTGSMKEGSALFQEVRAYARETPFRFADLEESARSLLAFNVPLNDVMRVLKMLGNISSVSSIPLKQLTDLYGRGKTQHRFFAQDLRELANASVDIKSALAKSLGVPIEEISELTRKGLLNFDMVDKAFSEMTSEGGRYFEGTEKLARTMGGQWDKLKDTVFDLAEEIGKGLRPAIESVTQVALQLIPQLEQPFRSILEMISSDRVFSWIENIGTAFTYVIDIVEVLVETIKAASAGIQLIQTDIQRWIVNTFDELRTIPGMKNVITDDMMERQRSLLKGYEEGAAYAAAGVARATTDGKIITSAEQAWNNMGERAKQWKETVLAGRTKYNELQDKKKTVEKKPFEYTADWLMRISKEFLGTHFGNYFRKQSKAYGMSGATAALGLGAQLFGVSDKNVKKDKEQQDQIKAGFHSFEGLNRSIQEALLKDNVQKKIEKNTAHSNVLLEKAGGWLMKIASNSGLAGIFSP